MATASAGDVYRDILEWGATLPLWQQELLRRVLPERDLPVAQIEELAAAAVSESEQQPSVYAPLSLADLPATASVQDARALLRLSRVRSVNALRSDQHLTFGPQLTIVYGDNGSGKSGYARVLKKVYRARVVEDILANLGSEQPSLDPCAATFTTKGADGAEVSVEWLDGTPIVNIGRFAVLDTACAGTYIRGGALAVGPSGIDVPRRFTEELDRVKNHIGRLMAASAPNKTALQRLENDTEAGRFIKGLSSATIDDAALASLRHWTGALRSDLAALPATDADAEAQLSALERTVLELTTRRSVSESIGSVRIFIATTRERQRLAQAERAINTRAASVKASDLHKKHMTARYAELVDEELRELRFRRRRPILAQATNKGTVQVTPLVSAELSHIPAEKVFSEGERTAIALACFLAELRVGDDPSGLIFDDPVSSLDHNVREHLARRLVAAAKTRQVIVFTHDLAFLADLREQAKKIQVVECAFRTLTATDYDAGFVEDEEPFGARNVGKRIKALRPLLGEIERAAKGRRHGGVPAPQQGLLRTATQHVGAFHRGAPLRYCRSTPGAQRHRRRAVEGAIYPGPRRKGPRGLAALLEAPSKPMTMPRRQAGKAIQSRI
jgi:recombinational DNA repair ATPase RecF